LISGGYKGDVRYDPSAKNLDDLEEKFKSMNMGNEQEITESEISQRELQEVPEWRADY